MIVELTENMIQDAFAKTGIDQKYYPQYETEVKRRYNALQKDDPDYEGSPDEDNAHSSINLTNEYIVYYVAEIEKGHCQQWAHSYAFYSVSGEDEYWIVRYALDTLEENERDKELDIHAKTINEDHVFIVRYKYLFNEGVCDAKKMADDYCRAYHQCIEKGKSEVYSHAYADIVNNGYYEEFCEIHAEAYELAIKHGMNEDDAYLFGDFCTEAADRNLLLRINEFSNKYKEDWQHDFLSKLQDRMMREQEAEVDTSTFDVPSTRRKTHEEAIWDMMYPEGIDDGFSLPED